MPRPDGRKPGELRPIKIERGFTSHAAGSVLIQAGGTKVICTAMAVEEVPPFLKGTGAGWVTAEYDMLPSSTHTRRARDYRRGGRDGRSQEIQRLIGRSLRSVVKRELLGERSIYIDCDVIEADGGTRTLSITGAYIALYDALTQLRKDGKLLKWPLTSEIAAVSVGIVGGKPMLDLCYTEDSGADVDMNIVATGKGGIVEIQGTAERRPFTPGELDKLMSLARTGLKKIFAIQRRALKK